MSNVRIEIVSASIRSHKGKSQKTGNDYEMRMQEAYLHNGHHYPERFEVPVPKNANGEFLSPYEPGMYTLAPASIQVNRQFGRLEISPFDMQLLRVVEQAPDAPAKPAAAAPAADGGAGKGKPAAGASTPF